MGRKFPVFLVLFGVPLTEIALFAYVGGRIGVLYTVGLVLLTALIGSTMLMQQGTATMARAREVMAAGGIPAREITDGILLLVSGLLLLTPGFLTDVIGFTLLFPPTRALVRTAILHRLQGQIVGGRSNPNPGHRPASTIEVLDDGTEPPDRQ